MVIHLDEQAVAEVLRWDALINCERQEEVCGWLKDKYGVSWQIVPATLLGSGVQAWAHLDALSRVCHLEEVRVWSRTPDHAKRFAQEHGARAMDAESAVRGADVIVTATNAREPILKGAWLKAGAHINAVGSPRPTWRELDDEAMTNVVVVDSREAVLKESGDVILSNAQIYSEAGEIFAGTKPAPVSETTVFKSVGIAIEDIATARLVYESARARSSS